VRLKVFRPIPADPSSDPITLEKMTMTPGQRRMFNEHVRYLIESQGLDPYEAESQAQGAWEDYCDTEARGRRDDDVHG
jgi:hypothetical protein